MPTVLIVEDEDLVREIATTEFAEAGYRVLEAATGEAALGHLGSDAVDLLFTDIRLPGTLDGWRIARRARELHPHLPVIYASGFPGDAIDVVPGGRFVRKPYRPVDILTMAAELSAAGFGGKAE
ncbi:MAG: response regulator [Sphingomonadaceae bacterium]|nr:response regulator [Sphingomonadaceae bacterium]